MPGPAPESTMRSLSSAVNMGLGASPLSPSLVATPLQPLTLPGVNGHGVLESTSTLGRLTTSQEYVSSNKQPIPTDSFKRSHGQFQPSALSTSSSVTACSTMTELEHKPEPVCTTGSSSPVPQAPEPTNAQRRPSSAAHVQESHNPFMRSRPSTALSLTDVESLSQILPPKRKLPFSKASPTRRHHPSRQGPEDHAGKPAHPRNSLFGSPMPQVPAVAADTANAFAHSSFPTAPSTEQHIAVESSRAASQVPSSFESYPVETEQTSSSSIPSPKCSVHCPGSHPLEGDTIILSQSSHSAPFVAPHKHINSQKIY
jgi:hypothetical protein